MMSTKIEKIVQKIIADGNGEFEGFLKLDITEQQKVVDLFEELITWQVKKHYSPALFFEGSEKPLESKLETILTDNGEALVDPNYAEVDEDGWCCNNCGDITPEHPFVHVYRKHYQPPKRTIKLVLVWDDGVEDQHFVETSLAPHKIRAMCEQTMKAFPKKNASGEWDFGFGKIPEYVAKQIGCIIKNYNGNKTQIETYWLKN